MYYRTYFSIEAVLIEGGDLREVGQRSRLESAMRFADQYAATNSPIVLRVAKYGGEKYSEDLKNAWYYEEGQWQEVGGIG